MNALERPMSVLTSVMCRTDLTSYTRAVDLTSYTRAVGGENGPVSQLDSLILPGDDLFMVEGPVSQLDSLILPDDDLFMVGSVDERNCDPNNGLESL